MSKFHNEFDAGNNDGAEAVVFMSTGDAFNTVDYIWETTRLLYTGGPDVEDFGAGNDWTFNARITAEEATHEWAAATGEDITHSNGAYSQVAK